MRILVSIPKNHDFGQRIDLITNVIEEFRGELYGCSYTHSGKVLKFNRHFPLTQKELNGIRQRFAFMQGVHVEQEV